LALIGVTIIWGTSFTLIKEALPNISTILFLTLRFSLAAAVMAVLYRKALLTGFQRRRAVLAGAAAGCCLALAYLLQTAGLRLTTPSRSAFLTSLCAVCVPLLGGAVYRNVPRWQEWAGVLLAMLGMGLLTAPAGGSVNSGDLMTVGCAVAFAGHILVIGRYAPQLGFEVLSVTQLAVVAALGSATFWWAEPVVFRPGLSVWLALAITALLCTALAFSVQAWAQQHTSATRAALIFSLEPVSAAFTSWIVAGEQLGTRGLAGAGLILAGVLAVELKPSAPREHP
jgi:drug/metabolite transporter (DMT)-like permease